jgi:hypothetical protein
MGSPLSHSDPVNPLCIIIKPSTSVCQCVPGDGIDLLAPRAPGVEDRGGQIMKTDRAQFPPPANCGNGVTSPPPLPSLRVPASPSFPSLASFPLTPCLTIPPSPSPSPARPPPSLPGPPLSLPPSPALPPRPPPSLPSLALTPLIAASPETQCTPHASLATSPTRPPRSNGRGVGGRVRLSARWRSCPVAPLPPPHQLPG